MARTKHTSISASIGKHNESIGGTLDYMAPEMLDDEKPVDSTKKTDVYAFAITLFEVINNGNRVWVTVDGKPMRPSAIERHVCKGSRPKRLEGVPDEIWSLIEQCWHQSPSERPKFAEILTSLDPYKDPNPAVDTLSNIISSSPPSSILSSPTHTFDLAKPTVDLETGNDFLCLQPGCPDRSLSPCSVQSDADLDSFPGVPASLQQLCKQGDPKACMQAAKAITEAKLASDPAWGHAARLFRAAANHGSPEAKFHLAWLSLAGIGTEQSDAEALALWQQIHDTSNDAEIKPISTFLLGWLCYLGRGSQQQNKEKGIVLMRQSKTNDFTLAEDSLEPESDPVSSNSVVAQLFFRLCLLGSEQDWLCKHLEAVCHIGGFGTAKDQAMAADLFDSLANQGHDVSQHWLGRCYGWGWGVPRNDPMSFNWYSQAASQHNSYAQSMVGRCYRNGWGVAKDDVKAVEWYTKSAEQGNAVAQWNLGRCYEHGTGVAVDMERAVLWYEKAADRGLTAARHRAQRIKDQRRV
ncbi:uncharacterized protein BJ171DRAFT_489571 [Polychytrium aggregatum]|uniref:uncharacterized protein n=1 Tax=Polychytrium aggregatum TaxID=110093 RepID=UPI0022FE59E3|nr:uncharacterized protein BJ171DRAFT_489571 [Polychytrium aggregatum]KAI9208642.1 hypothetical protein BJ171DRAFT_489571 [Polychytrium aggregatum]